MSRVVSFPQLFAIARGANYRTLIPFTGVPFTTLLSNAFATPSNLDQANAIPGVFVSGDTNYVLSGTSQTFQSLPVFSYGGDLSNKDFVTLYPFESVKYVVGGNPAKTMGDWLMLFRASGADSADTSAIYYTQDGCVMENFPNRYSRCVLTDALDGTNHSASAPSLGYYIIGSSDADFVWEGKIEPWGENNTANSFRTIVGLHRTHRNSTNTVNTKAKNPFGPFALLPLNGEIIGFVPFEGPNNTFRWCFIVVGIDSISGETDLGFSVTTNFSAFDMCKLRITYNRGTFSAYINDQLVVNELDHLIYVESQAEFLQWGIECREIQSTSLMPNPIVDTHKILTKQMTLSPGGFDFTTNTRDLFESSYHNTGIQLLKKLK